MLKSNASDRGVMKNLRREMSLQNKIIVTLGAVMIAAMMTTAIPVTVHASAAASPAKLSASSDPASVSGKAHPVPPAGVSPPSEDTPAGCVDGTNAYWGNSAAFGSGLITKQDTCGNVMESFVPASATYSNGRGIAVDDEGNVLYTALLGTGGGSCAFSGFCGDGLIHKIDQSGGGDLATIPDPFGFGGDGVGAITFTKGKLWGVEYLAAPGGTAGGTHLVFKANPATGTVLASCNITDDGSIGDDTLTVKGKFFFTDNGESNPTLNEYQLPGSVSSAPCTFVTSFTLPFGPTGIDFGFQTQTPKLYASSLGSINNLGPAPYGVVLNSFFTSTGTVEDIESYAGPQKT